MGDMAGLNANTALLIHGDETDGSQSLVDSSTTATKTITCVGNAQADTAQKVFGAGSVLFDGNGDELTIPDHADWDLMASATQDYTIDFRIKYNSHTDGERWIQQWDPSGAAAYWSFQMNSSGPNFIVWNGTTVPINITGANFTDGNWHHMCLVKKGAATAEFGIYNDGVQVAYGSTSGTLSIAGLLYIGARNEAAEPLNGWMDEIRIQKDNYFNASPNVGLTDTITVPTAAYDNSINLSVNDSSAVTEAVSLYLDHLDINVNDSSSVTESVDLDLKQYNLTVNDSSAVTEDVTVLITELFVSCFDATSVTEDLVIETTPKVISVYDSSSVTEDVTILLPELFISVFDAPTVTEYLDTQVPDQFLNVYDSSSVTESLSVEQDSYNISILEDASGITEDLVIGITPKILEVFDSSEVTDATEVAVPTIYASVSDETTVTDDTTLMEDHFEIVVYESVSVVEEVSSELNSLNVSGYDSSSITEGITPNVPTLFLVPTDQSLSKLILHGDGSNGGTTFTDSSPSNKAVTAVAHTNTSTTSPKFGTAAILFDGTDDGLTLEDSADWDIVGSTTSKWTVSFFIKYTAVGGASVGGERLVSQWEDNDNYWSIAASSSSTQLIVASGGNVIIQANSTTAITDNNWHHLAMVKDGTTYAMYLDGTQISYVQDNSTDTFAGLLYLGHRSGTEFLGGRMDDIVIINDNLFGATPNAAKTSTITVPTAAFAPDADTTVVTESVSLVITSPVSVYDSSEVTDTATVLITTLHISVYDDTSVTDYPSLVITSNSAVYDSSAVTDAVTLSISLNASVYDTSNLTESVTIIQYNLVPSVYDSVTITESVTVNPKVVVATTVIKDITSTRPYMQVGEDKANISVIRRRD